MLNNITIQGRLTKDPELRRTQTGTAVTSFSIACEEDYKQNDGSRKTHFFDCVAWGHTGEFIADYFQKGNMIYLKGRLTNRSWTDKAGNKRTQAEIVVEGGYFGEGRKTGHAANTAATPGEFSEIPEDTDLPF